jgi:exopolyphosphatase/guanosine-5'-triphosphate,3'-diphosphate pyrophosphatase
MRTVASLDIGTNSTLFLLAQVDEAGRITPLRHEVRTNDLGRGLDAQGRLSPEVISLNLKQFQEFNQIATAGGAQEIRPAATEALRRAQNADELIRRARSELGLEIRIISGQEEARLTYLGVISGLNDPAERILLADVGGGSTEIILGAEGKTQKSVSLPIGAVGLDRTFIRHDPATPDEVESIREHIRTTLAKMDVFHHPTARLFICGGAASALASADLGLATYQPAKIASHRMTLERLGRFIEQFRTLNLESRRAIPGIGRRRAEIILPGALIIAELLEALGREEYYTSERGLRYGLILR